MNKKFFCFDNPKNAVLVCFGLLLAVGCVNVYSASFVYATSEMDNSYHFVARYIMFALASIWAFWVMRKIGYKFFLQQNVLLCFGGAIFLLLGCVLVFGPEINAAKRWLDFGFFHLQPSEFAKLFIVLLSSSMLGKHLLAGRRANVFHAPAGYCILWSIVFAALVFVQPDMGTAGIIFGLPALLCLLAGVRRSQIVLAGIVVLGIAVTFIWHASYRFNRVLMWLDPWQDPTGNGYQMVQSFIAIGSGGYFGTDWGAGTAKLFFLPELHTDFAFAIFCQENGFVGATLIIALFVLLGFALWTIAKRTTDPTGFLLVSGIIFLVVGQAVANMAMVCGLLPIIGVPLSFISYGGSSMFASSLGLGLVLSVYDNECKMEKEQAETAKMEQQSPIERRRSWQIIKGNKR
ncbi:MAG: cell division protein FtsW [Phascolarctobacterium sp.]|nr:cell division protein FtsW [Candidatus Phascolarctobacterium caballi]